MYPLQTFNRERVVDFAQVPIFVEGKTAAELEELTRVARSISKSVEPLTSKKRMLLHVAAVFACNFANHLLATSAQLLHESRLNFEVLKPLIRETFEKAQAADSPAEVQTGPAVRGDVSTVQKHLGALARHPQQQQLYRLLSESIMMTKL